ncbi:MAG: transcription termination/antitermination protein NusG [Alphaproteobacteria bacterium]
MMRWYVASTHCKAESRALWHLANQGYRGYLPRYRKRRTHARRTELVPAPLFPGYIFIEVDIDSTRWHPIRSTVGIRHLICHGNHPVPVPKGIVEDIMAREGEDGIVRAPSLPAFADGEPVRVTAGAFHGQVGIFECQSDDERIVILLEMLGRRIRVPLPLHSVRACV